MSFTISPGCWLDGMMLHSITVTDEVGVGMDEIVAMDSQEKGQGLW